MHEVPECLIVVALFELLLDCQLQFLELDEEFLALVLEHERVLECLALEAFDGSLRQLDDLGDQLGLLGFELI